MIDRKLKEALAELGIDFSATTTPAESGRETTTFRLSYPCVVDSHVCSAKAKEVLDTTIDLVNEKLRLIGVSANEYQSLAQVHYGNVGDLCRLEKLLDAALEFISETAF